LSTANPTPSVAVNMPNLARWFALFFFLSGFCSLVYQVVWLRLSMASFGVTTPIVSIVVSVFMAGLAIGSWAAGRLTGVGALRYSRWNLRLYGLVECLISTSVFMVPAGLVGGRRLIAGWNVAHWGSVGYNVASLLAIAAVMLPFCIAMGSTFPFALAALRLEPSTDGARRFSGLYAANVAGATLGSLAAAFVMIESLGFRGSLTLTAGLNVLLGAGALALSLRRISAAGPKAEPQVVAAQELAPAPQHGQPVLWLLFGTGIASLAMEIVWSRQYTPFLGNLVYSFATIVATYLAATYVGTFLYRHTRRAGRPHWAGRGVWYVLIALSLLPSVCVDPRLPVPDSVFGAVLRVALGVGPFCAALGFLTPSLIDHFSGGDPQRAGSAYAVNTVGCILGPLLASFVLLPLLPERWTIVGLALALLALVTCTQQRAATSRPVIARYWLPVSIATACGLTGFVVRSSDDFLPSCIVLRDNTATVTAVGKDRRKELLVNGIGTTTLTPITKMMAHMPLALRQQPSRNALVICFGMGTSFRSACSWGLNVTAVELVPSVPALFGFYHPDGPALLKLPQAHIVIDDGRRFLEWSRERYDLILIDPTPPPEAAGSSLLYSVEFYQAAEAHLRSGGIVQQWIPHNVDSYTALAFIHAFAQSFPHLRFFTALKGNGLHMLGSEQPIDVPSAAVLASRLPSQAAADLVEWYPGSTAEMVFDVLLSHEISAQKLIAAARSVPPLTDDRPANEYFVLRRWRGHALFEPPITPSPSRPRL
jgi:spermidine synthase